jgi:hypothetical protein
MSRLKVATSNFHVAKLILCDMTFFTLEKEMGIGGWLIVGVKVQNFLFDTMTP